LATRILTEFKQKIRGLELEPSGGGCFELTLDGKLVYSKLQTGQFPDEEAMLAEVKKRLGGGA
jgi:selenoprotein W-related protein